MSNYLEGIFHPAYSFDTISGFQTILNTSLEGNVTIGNLNTSFELLLNGLPIPPPFTYEWSEHPAVQYVMINGYDISGVSSFNNISAVFIGNSLNRVGLGNNVLSDSFGSNNTAFGNEAARFNNGSEVNAMGHFAGYLNTGSNVNAFGFGSALSNSGNFVNAIGYNAGYSNIGSNCSFLGSNPDILSSNTFDNRFIAYSTNSSNPFLYGDTSNNQLSVGTSDLSANLTISGSLFATGSIYDSTYSTGVSGQVLSSTATGVKWATIPGGNAASRVYVDRVNLGGSFNSVGGYGYPPFLTSPEFLLRSYSSAALSLLIQNWDSITVNVMLSVQTGNFDWCGIQWICDDYNNSILTSASVQTSFVPPAVGGPQNLVPISLTFVLIKGVHYTNSTTTLKLVGACTNGAAFWNTWDDGSTVHTSDLVTNFIGGY